MDALVLPRAAKNEEPTPLLPSVLTRPSAYVWLWILPVALLLGLNSEAYALISGNMTAAERGAAGAIGLAGLGDLLLGIATFVVARRLSSPASRDAALPWWFGFAAVAVNVG